VVGVGNVLMGDEGVGVEVMRALESRVGSGTAVAAHFIDAGTGFFTMVSDLDRYEAVVIIDAASGGGQPGSMYRLGLNEDSPAAPGSGGMRGTPASGFPALGEQSFSAPMSLHDFGVLESIAWERVRGKLKGKVVLFGIEPSSVELRLGLSKPLRAKMGQYVESILKELKEMEGMGKQSGCNSPDRGGA
jgi:hydrogenase maturation protease